MATEKRTEPLLERALSITVELHGVEQASVVTLIKATEDLS